MPNLGTTANLCGLGGGGSPVAKFCSIRFLHDVGSESYMIPSVYRPGVVDVEQQKVDILCIV